MASLYRRKYRHRAPAYARHYRIAETTVRRYMMQGAPLDQPEKMGAWSYVRRSRPKSFQAVLVGHG